MSATVALSVVVPTYGRDEVLVATLRSLLALVPGAAQIVVADQTVRHDPPTTAALEAMRATGSIEWLRLAEPSIPAAMNAGLLAAREEVVLFLDDDVEPSPALLAAHGAAHAANTAEIVVGQVLEPGQAPEALVGPEFGFRSSVRQPVDEVIGCNFSVRRRLALAIGGFDENFVAVAYRFEADFCERARAAGARIRFEPAASLVHLRAPRGGTRAFGDHLRTIRPSHAVGEYYFLMKSREAGRWRRMLSRPWRAVRSRHHLRRPWWIPVTLVAEMAGWVWALRLRLRGQRLLSPPAAAGEAA